MKKQLFFSLIMMLYSMIAFAQQDVDVWQKLADIQKSRMINFVQVSMNEQDPFNLCQVIYEWDGGINNFKKVGTTEISYEVEDGQDVYTTEGEVTSEDGTQKFKVVSYGGFNNFLAEEDIVGENGDSMIIFAELEGMGLVPLLKMYNTFEDGKLVLTEQYIDFSLLFGIPLGFLLAGTTEYRYDDGQLVNKITANLDFFSGEMAVADSTVYRYNGLGQLGEEKLYSLDENQVFYLAQKTTRAFNAAGMMETETDFFYTNDGTETNKTRSNFSYDSQGRLASTITETYDYETDAFMLDTKTSNEYAKELPLGFPTRQLYQLYETDKWVNSDLATMDYCSTSQIDQTALMNVNAWVSGNLLQLSGIGAFSDQAQISLFDMSGRRIFSAAGNLRSRYDLGEILSGIYILELKDRDQRISKKLFVQF